MNSKYYLTFIIFAFLGTSGQIQESRAADFGEDIVAASVEMVESENSACSSIVAETISDGFNWVQDTASICKGFETEFNTDARLLEEGGVTRDSIEGAGGVRVCGQLLGAGSSYIHRLKTIATGHDVQKLVSGLIQINTAVAAGTLKNDDSRRVKKARRDITGRVASRLNDGSQNRMKNFFAFAAANLVTNRGGAISGKKSKHRLRYFDKAIKFLEHATVKKYGPYALVGLAASATSAVGFMADEAVTASFGHCKQSESFVPLIMLPDGGCKHDPRLTEKVLQTIARDGHIRAMKTFPEYCHFMSETLGQAILELTTAFPAMTLGSFKLIPNKLVCSNMVKKEDSPKPPWGFSSDASFMFGDELQDIELTRWESREKENGSASYHNRTAKTKFTFVLDKDNTPISVTKLWTNAGDKMQNSESLNFASAKTAMESMTSDQRALFNEANRYLSAIDHVASPLARSCCPDGKQTPDSKICNEHVNKFNEAILKVPSATGN